MAPTQPSVKPSRSFTDWVPIHIFESGPQPEVLWSHLAKMRFEDPFFLQTITKAVNSPLTRLLQRTTSLDELIATAEQEPSVEPAGFIFHVTRCGSTLISQMFARLARIISISEAQPLTAVADDARLSAADRARAFRALIRLYGRKVTGHETASVFKFGPRELFAWGAIAGIYPHVPRIIMQRDPLEVLVSNLAQSADVMLPGNLPPAVLGPPPFPIETNEDYAAFVCSRIYAHAAEAAHAPGSLTINYPELPQAVESVIAPHFGIPLDHADRAAMQATTRLYAKDASRSTVFVPDSETKQRSAAPATRKLIAKWFQLPNESDESLNSSSA